MYKVTNTIPTTEFIKTSMPGHYMPPSTYVNEIHPLSKEAMAFIDENCFFCTVPKGGKIYKEGEICSYVFIVNKGALRGYIRDGQKEITTWISVENEMVTAIGSFFMQVPSVENIQAIEDCELTGLHYNDLQYVYEHFPETNIAGRKLLEFYYREAEERAYISRLTKAKSRYVYFLASKPHLLNRIPLKYIASFLGNTIETLSRLRNSLSKRNKPYVKLDSRINA